MLVGLALAAAAVLILAGLPADLAGLAAFAVVVVAFVIATLRRAPR